MAGAQQLPKIDRRILGGFRWFIKRYLKKHFHSVAVDRSALEQSQIAPTDSLVVYANHSSWWDPIGAMILDATVFDAFDLYAPIDAKALEKYRMFSRMGFYGVDQSSLRGAAEFLKTSSAILDVPSSSIWITPEGRFVDVRDESAGLESGISHLAHRLHSKVAKEPDSRRIWFIPLAVEYTFWEERLPEMLSCIGTPICVAGDAKLAEHLPKDKLGWNQLLTLRLRATQRRLADLAVARDSSPFEILVGGTSGTFFVYDWFRRANARLRGRGKMHVDHSDKLRSDET